MYQSRPQRPSSGVFVRITSLWRSIAFGLSASFALVANDAAANTIAYAEDFFTGGSFVRLNFIDPPQYISSFDILFVTGAFVNNDFSKEYMIRYINGDLYSIDVVGGSPILIGTTSTPGNDPKGMHWDPVSGQVFLIATDASCATSTLYTLDVSDASTVEVGSTPGCIISLAIDAEGHAFGIEQTAEALVSIDTTTGAATPIGPLGFRAQSIISGFDFHLDSGLLYLFATDPDAGIRGIYTVDTTVGNATLVGTYDRSYIGLAFARQFDAILANGFDP